MSEVEHTVEKHYCYDHPSAYQNNDALIGAIMSANNKHQCDPSAMMAMMNNNGWQNNPFMYLIWLAFFGGGNGFGWGGNRADVAQNADLSRQLQTLQGTVADNHNNDLALQAINGNRDALGQLAQTFNTDITAIQQAICSVKSAIEQVGGSVGYSAEKVINAINLGDANIMSKMQDCCCQQKQLIQQMGYENQLANERQTNTLGSQIADFKASNQLQMCQQTNAINNSITNVREAVVNGFSNIGYTMAQQTCELKTNQNENTQRIIDTLNNHWQSETQLALQDEKFKNSQLQQNQYLASLIQQNNCGCNC